MKLLYPVASVISLNGTYSLSFPFVDGLTLAGDASNTSLPPVSLLFISKSFIFDTDS